MPPVTLTAPSRASGDQWLAADYLALRADDAAVEAHVLDHTHRGAYYGRSSDRFTQSGSVAKTYGLLTVLNPSGAARPTLNTVTSGTGTTTTLPTGSTGDLLILSVATYGTSGDTIGIPSGWLPIDSQTDLSGSESGVVRNFYKIRGGAESAPTLSGTGYTTLRWMILDASGVSSTEPFLSFLQTVSGSASQYMDLPATDYNVPDNYRRALVINMTVGSSARTWTVASGWTEHADAQGIEIAYLDLSTSQATTATDGVGATPYRTVTTTTTSVPASTAGVVVCSLSVPPGRYAVMGGLTTAAASTETLLARGPRYDTGFVRSKGITATVAGVAEVGSTGVLTLLAYNASGDTVSAGAWLHAWRIG